MTSPPPRTRRTPNTYAKLNLHGATTEWRRGCDGTTGFARLHDSWAIDRAQMRSQNRTALRPAAAQAHATDEAVDSAQAVFVGFAAFEALWVTFVFCRYCADSSVFSNAACDRVR